MNWDWKDWFIAITIGTIGILAMFTIVDWTIEKDGSVGVGTALSFIGAILGGIISGILTLLGVRLTIKEQRISMVQEKVAKAEFIYKKMAFKLGDLNFYIADFYEPKQAYHTTTNLIKIINDHSEMLKETEIEFVIRIEVIKKELEDIEKDFDDVDGPDGRFAFDLLEVLEIRNRIIQTSFKSIKVDYFSKYK